MRAPCFDVVIAGLDPAIHSVTALAAATVPEWMPGSSPGMTTVLRDPTRLPLLLLRGHEFLLGGRKIVAPFLGEILRRALAQERLLAGARHKRVLEEGEFLKVG